MRILQAAASLALLSLLSGCLSVRIGTHPDPSVLEMDGLASGYVTASAWPEWDGTLFRLGLFGHSCRDGEILTLDLYPLVGFGIGLVGARVRILPVEAGLGVLFYSPKPERSSRPKSTLRKVKTEEEEEEEPEEQPEMEEVPETEEGVSAPQGSPDDEPPPAH